MGPASHLFEPLFVDWWRSPLPVGHSRFFLKPQIVLGMAAIGGKVPKNPEGFCLSLAGHLNNTELKPTFLLPAWGWVVLGFIYSMMAFRVFLP